MPISHRVTIPITRISPKHQITIPKEIYESLQLEVGDFLNVKVEGEKIIIVPTKMIPKDQAWFWTKEWQEKEREAEEDIKAGKLYGPFRSGKELVKSLKSKR